MLKPIRILFLSHDSGIYGAQQSLLGLLEKIDRDRFEPMVIAPDEGSLTEAVRSLKIPVRIRLIIHWIASGSAAKKAWFYRTKKFISGLRGRVWALAYQIEQNEIDIVYTNTITCIEGALAARITGRPHIWHLREQINGNSQLRTLVPVFLVRWLIYALSQRVLVNSHYLYKSYQTSCLHRKLVIVYNGVDPNKFNFDRKESTLALKNELGISTHSQIVTIIGSIIPRKGLDLFVEAAHQLLESDIDATFLVVGDGPSDNVQRVKNHVERYGMGNRFHFLSHRDDIPRLMAGVNLLVVAADEEPFGRTVIEAMAAGVPVVSTRCGGPEEIVLDEITGLLVPPRSPSVMAATIKRILGEPELAAKFINAGKERLNQKFTLEAYAASVQSEIENVIQSSRTNCMAKET